MSHEHATAEERYAEIVETLAGAPGVSRSSDETRGRFGSSGQLKVNGKIFAMLVRGRLVVKISRARVDALLAAGEGERFDPGHGRLMKEWVTVEPSSAQDWLPLAREAMEFVAGGNR